MMRNVLFACALVFGTSVGCSSSYTPGEYATIGYRAPSHADAGAAPARGRLRGEGAASRRAAPARRRTAPAPTTGPAEASRPGAADAAASRAEASAAQAAGAARQP